jgi:hypothetical protein
VLYTREGYLYISEASSKGGEKSLLLPPSPMVVPNIFMLIYKILYILHVYVNG